MDDESRLFLFVNEDETSVLSRGRRRTGRNAINSHVQHTVHYRRQAASLRRLKQYIKFRRPGLHSAPCTEPNASDSCPEKSLVVLDHLCASDSIARTVHWKEPVDAEQNEWSLQRDEDSNPLKPQLLTTSMSRDFPPRLSNEFGGLRDDPFQTYPIESRGCVLGAIDYFVSVYAPWAFRAPQDRATDMAATIFPAYFRLILHDAMVFEQIVVYSEVLQLVRRGLEVRLSPELMYRLNNVYLQLRRRLETAGESTSDAVILTILPLMSLNHTLKNLQAFMAHADGLLRIVALRGGVDNLGWNGFLKSRILQYGFYILSAVKLIKLISFRLEAAISARRERSHQELSYPSHPYSPDLCQRILKLPSGFGRLARTGTLNLLLIDFIEQLGGHLEENTTTKAVSSCTAAYMMLLDIPQLNTVERWILSTLLSFCIAIDRILRGPGFANPVHTLRVDAQVMLLAKGGHTKSCDPDFLAWAAFVLRATTEPGTESRKWANQFFSSVPMTERRQRELEKDFWPIPRANPTVGSDTLPEASDSDTI